MEKITIEEMDLPIRTYNCLKKNNINYLDELLILSDKQLSSIPLLGKKGMAAIKEKLEIFKNNEAFPAQETDDHPKKIEDLNKEEYDSLTACFTEKEKAVFEMFYGFTDGEPKTTKEIAAYFNTSEDNIKHLLLVSYRKLRHPVRYKTLDVGSEEFEEDFSKAWDKEWHKLGKKIRNNQ